MLVPGESEKAQQRLRLTALGVVFGTFAGLWFYLVQRKQREREQQRLESQQQVAAAEQKRLQERLKRQDAERRQQDAERTALELKSR